MQSCAQFQSVFVSVLIYVCLLHRLVNENEVKQWREQAEKFRKGKNLFDTLHSAG